MLAAGTPVSLMALRATERLRESPTDSCTQTCQKSLTKPSGALWAAVRASWAQIASCTSMPPQSHATAPTRTASARLAEHGSIRKISGYRSEPHRASVSPLEPRGDVPLPNRSNRTQRPAQSGHFSAGQFRAVWITRTITTASSPPAWAIV